MTLALTRSCVLGVSNRQVWDGTCGLRAIGIERIVCVSVCVLCRWVACEEGGGGVAGRDV